jgi:hypothetical protein
MPVILATGEAEIERIEDQGQPRQTSSSKRPHLQDNQRKMDWRYGSSNRAPAMQA